MWDGHGRGYVLRGVYQGSFLISPHFSWRREENSPISPLTPPLFLLYSPLLLMVSPDKVAVCLTCGNEWEVRKPGVGKKRKCPLCGKYKVKMKSEVKDDGNKPNPGSKDPADGAPDDVPVGATPPDHSVDDATSDGVDEKRRRKEENSPTSPENSPRSPLTSHQEKSGEKGEENGGGIITYAALLLLAVGAGWFLVSVHRRRRADAVDSGYDEVEQYNPRAPAFPGF